jgi:hypothetical protein
MTYINAYVKLLSNKNSTPLCVTTMFFYNIVSINIYYAESDWFLGLLGDNTA